MYLLRSVGLGLGFFSVAAAVAPLNPSGWVWGLMLFNGFMWSHVAYHLAKRSAQPYEAEQRNLLIDSISGGFWVGVMGLNPLPTVTVLAMMAMHNAAVGGPRFFLKGSAAQASGAIAAILLFSPTFTYITTPFQVYACLPMLSIYPLLIGMACYRLALKLSEHKHALSKLSRTDSLTGLINHGAWKDMLRVEFSHCQTHLRQTTVALIDIDHFKAINDTYGHIVGDGVLKQLSAGLFTCLRDTDLAGRYGGDEFCVILPDTTVKEATQILDRLRLSVNGFRDIRYPELEVSLSVGVAAFGPHLADAGMWLHEADMALYAAKSTGRNRISCAEIQEAAFAPSA